MDKKPSVRPQAGSDSTLQVRVVCKNERWKGLGSVLLTERASTQRKEGVRREEENATATCEYLSWTRQICPQRKCSDCPVCRWETWSSNQVEFGFSRGVMTPQSRLSQNRPSDARTPETNRIICGEPFRLAFQINERRHSVLQDGLSNGLTDEKVGNALRLCQRLVPHGRSRTLTRTVTAREVTTFRDVHWKA